MKGFSQNWQDVLEATTGSRNMDGNSIKEYFAPASKSASDLLISFGGTTPSISFLHS